jgi:hypothetical protein
VNDANSTPATKAEDFSIVLGGPIYQLFRKAHLSGSALELLKRRLVGIPLFMWLPLLVLAIVEGRAVRGTPMPFAADIDVHGRCLVSIALLILAEFVAHRRLSGIVKQFTDRGLIAPEDVPRFEAMKASAVRMRNSVAAEVVQIVLAFGVHWLWGSGILERGDSWIGKSEGGAWSFTAAGWWYAFVTLPIFRVFLFRWYYRIFIWYRFVWQVGRLPLRLDALHPDRVAGLGFLAATPAIFTPILLAHSVFVAAMIQGKIWGTGAKLPDFKFEIGGTIVFLSILVLTPLFFFVAKIALAKREANAEYGALASRYVSQFREKWLGRGAKRHEGDLVGSGDIQSLADLSGAYDAVRETRLVPITRQAFVQLLVVAALPLLPLGLNLMPWEELLKRLVGVLF